MNNSDLAASIANARGLTKVEARSIVDTLFEKITEAVARGEEVTIAGFGRFRVKDRAAREGRNPRTGDPMKIPASKNLTLTPAAALKRRLNGK